MDEASNFVDQAEPSRDTLIALAVVPGQDHDGNHDGGRDRERDHQSRPLPTA